MIFLPGYDYQKYINNYFKNAGLCSGKIAIRSYLVILRTDYSRRCYPGVFGWNYAVWENKSYLCTLFQVIILRVLFFMVDLYCARVCQNDQIACEVSTTRYTVRLHTHPISNRLDYHIKLNHPCI